MSAYYEPLTHIVLPEEDGLPVKTILNRHFRLSRRLMSRLKLTEQGITVNGQRVYISVPVRTGDRVEVRMEEEQSDDILPQEMALTILYEDEVLLILDKPAGIIVHPTVGHYANTLANGVVHYWMQQGKSYRFRPVHRLDQETSGVLAVAKNPYVHQQLSEQMKADRILKEYLALVHGGPAADSGTIDAPIDRDTVNPHVRVVTPTGYPSVTHYAVERRFAEASLVRLRLETGRTHQIRVHMKHIGCPLIGDSMYGPAEDEAKAVVPASILARQALHAARLGFTHPIRHEQVVFEAPLPDDFHGAIAHLERATSR